MTTVNAEDWKKDFGIGDMKVKVSGKVPTYENSGRLDELRAKKNAAMQLVKDIIDGKSDRPLDKARGAQKVAQAAYEEEFKKTKNQNSFSNGRAKAGFNDGMGHARLGSIASMTIEAFKQWLAEGNTTKPVAG